MNQNQATIENNNIHRLFIIGNGFDLAHKYPTRYSDFKTWMENRLRAAYPYLEIDDDGRISLEEVWIPDVVMGNHGEEVVDGNQSIYMLMWLLLNNSALDDEWNLFEESLHDIDVEGIINNNNLLVENSCRDRDGVINPFYVDSNYAEMASNIRVSVGKITNLFEEWINSIDIDNKGQLSIRDKMDQNSLYLTFNYTETLEKVYGVPSYLINHIHGMRHCAWGYYPNLTNDCFGARMLCIGHGNDEARDFDTEYVERENILQNIIRDMRKPVDEIIQKNKDFWNKLKRNKIKEIYCHGFSFSEVDLPYIRQIIASINGGIDVIWYLNTYDDTADKPEEIPKNIRYEQLIRDCGFEGEFERFDTSQIQERISTMYHSIMDSTNNVSTD